MSEKKHQLDNQLATLLTFKPCAKGGKRTELIPTKPLALTKDELDALHKRDPVFREYWRIRAVEAPGWEPSGKPERLLSLPRHMIPPHRPIPDEGMNDPRNKPPEEPLPSTEPIEPTPTSGVPGNANQASALVHASMNPTQLEQWAEVETRKTVLKAIDERLQKLASVPKEELEGVTPPGGEYVAPPPVEGREEELGDDDE